MSRERDSELQEAVRFGRIVERVAVDQDKILREILAKLDSIKSLKGRENRMKRQLGLENVVSILDRYLRDGGALQPIPWPGPPRAGASHLHVVGKNQDE